MKRAIMMLLGTGAVVAAGLCAGLTAPTAKAAGGGDKLDVVKLSCADVMAIRSGDPERFTALAQWVAGWRAEPPVATDLSFPAVQIKAEKWADSCAATPNTTFIELTSVLTKKDMTGQPVISMAAFKCQNFIDLLDKDKTAAMGIIRWLDGWNAGALEQTSINFYYHKKQMASATDGCMKYPKKALMEVVAGKYR